MVLAHYQIDLHRVMEPPTKKLGGNTARILNDLVIHMKQIPGMEWNRYEYNFNVSLHIRCRGTEDRNWGDCCWWLFGDLDCGQCRCTPVVGANSERMFAKPAQQFPQIGLSALTGRPSLTRPMLLFTEHEGDGVASNMLHVPLDSAQTGASGS